MQLSSPLERLSLTKAEFATTLVYYLIFIGLGLVSASLGPTLEALAQQTGSNLGQISGLFMARSSGFLLDSFLGGRLYDSKPGHRIMMLLLLLLGGMLIITPMSTTLWFLLPIMLLIGIGLGGIDIGGNALLVWLHKDRVDPYMNGLHFIWGLGAFLSPLLIAQAIGLGGSVQWAFWLLAVFILPLTLLVLPLPSPQPIQEEVDRSSRASDPILIALITLFFFVYIGGEVGVSGWIYTYATRMDLADETNAALINSIFFGALTLTRLVIAVIAVRVKAERILLVNLLTCLISAALLYLIPTSSIILWFGVIGLGIGMSSIFPSMLALAQNHLALTGRTTSWFFVGGSLGGMSLPFLIGQLFEPVGPQIVVIVIFSCFAAALIVFEIIRRR